MTKEEYKAEGYELSTLIDQAVIDKAESEIIDAYISPLTQEAAPECETRQAVMDLTFLLLSQRNIFITRAGAKVKLSATSTTTNGWDTLREQAAKCDLSLKRLMKAAGVDRKAARVVDICKIYYRTNYFYN